MVPSGRPYTSLRSQTRDGYALREACYPDARGLRVRISSAVDVAVTATRASLPTMPALRNLRQPRVRRLPRSELARWPLGLQIEAVPPVVHVMLVLHLAGCASQFE